MTICNKIQTLGETMETNLNARGVSCTFGTGTNESTILEMVEMVNSTNFKGSSDVNLKIGANRPYLLENETTDVVVKLENGLCEPLKNKNVIVGQSVFRDGGVTGDTNSNWYKNSGTDNRTVTGTGTTLANTTSTRYDIFAYFGISDQIYVFQPPYTVEFDIVDIVGSNARFQIYDKVTKDTYNGNFTVGHWKIVYDGTTIKPYYNGVEQTNYTRNMPNARIGFYIPQDCSITYKNFVIYETINGVTDGKGEFALYNVSVTDDTTFTATYGTETATCLVEYCDFVDYAVTNNKNNTWFNNTGGIITVDDSGTTFTSVPHGNGTHWTCGYCPSSTTSRNPFSYPIVVEFDILHWTDSGSIWIKSDLGNRTSFNRELNHIGSRARIEIGTTSTKIYIDGTLVSTKTYTQPSTYGIELGYYTAKSNFPTAPSLKFANLSIRPL